MTDIDKKASYFAISQNQVIPGEEMLETGRRKKKLTIGMPLEIDKNENRIALSPQGVELLTGNGHEIIMESGTGDRANYFDKDFSEAGAIITKNREEVYKSEIVLKISPPNQEETELLHPNQLLLSYLRISSQSAKSIRQLMSKKINALSYEFMKDSHDCYPVIRSMSEIEGYAAITIASEYLSKVHGGKGVLLGGITGVSPAEVVIIGAGTAGEFAARAALGLGCQVKIFDNSYQKLKDLERNTGQKLFTSILHPQVLVKALKSADAVITSLRYFDSDYGFLITREDIEKMKPGSIIIDLSAGNGGCFESDTTFKASIHPVVDKRGVICYSVPNVSSRVARTASIALSNIFAPALLKMADAGGVHQLLKENPGVRNGTYIYKGILTNNHIANRFNIPAKDIGLLLAAF
ncbi:alanine dehydrogenase [Marinilabiliaceae bacterium ANBcel2]|nr:alanine dehydrogenase [Marinilabiliaceae bacterium ANBcel2]